MKAKQQELRYFLLMLIQTSCYASYILWMFYFAIAWKFCFSTHFKGESPQEERRGREENGKRKGKGAYSCALLSFVVKNSNFLHICMYLCMQTETHVPVRLVLIIKNSSLMNTSNFWHAFFLGLTDVILFYVVELLKIFCLQLI